MHRKALLEILFWAFTVVVAIAVLLPIVNEVEGYPFLFINIVYIVTAITVTRYLFLLPHTFLARLQPLKVILVFLCLPFVFYLVQELNNFQVFIDEKGLDALVGDLPYARRNNMVDYIRSEMLLFGTGSIISSVSFPFRLLVSVWRTRNWGTV
ncbi:MAG: hypothetical protein H6573_21765 [Lewinellaceae bacterium]|nr:hypothetical protein [Phaeodactylibacter sp.]MCB9350110.1 hypothetical protein [Lewinellaceae bacterium]